MASTDEIKSPLLRLPGELRNRIFEFALTAPRSLIVYIGNSTRPVLYLPADEDHPEVAIPYITTPDQQVSYDHGCYSYNQLKLVNKQLYQETKGLELKFNSLRVLGRVYDIPEWHMPNLSFFIERLSPEKKGWISSLIIDMGPPISGKRSARLHGQYLASLFRQTFGIGGIRRKFVDQHPDIVLYELDGSFLQIICRPLAAQPDLNTGGKSRIEILEGKLALD
jgi:hypothetical protein